MGISRNQVAAIIMILLIVVFYGGFRYGQARANIEGVIIDLTNSASGISTGYDNKEKILAQETRIDQKGEMERKIIKVHVVGEVKAPGLYQLLEGDRVYDGVMLAGPTEEAHLDVLNLAQIVMDGGKITVPRQGEIETEAAAAAWSGGVEYPALAQGPVGQTDRVNINTAGEKELADRLPGIGPVLAKRIVDHRIANGHFQSTQDLTKVSGIGPKIYESLKDLIMVR
ncbi:MAG: helix-hairpin-helix domain-containing protein [Clostridia bacterium]|jgi:competence protein ComEA|nr:helix-hairpin-helix domain-containing protein [Clostridia bacterium]